MVFTNTSITQGVISASITQGGLPSALENEWEIQKQPLKSELQKEQRIDALESTSLQMQSNPLLLIEDFSETVSAIFKSFSQICKAHSEKMREARPEFVRLERNIAAERRRRMELEAIVRERINRAPTEASADTSCRRLTSGFQLYLLEEKNRVLKEHPSLDTLKVGKLAVIKWEKLKREQQLAYERKVQEMNKISDAELLQASLRLNSDPVYIKREHNQEEAEGDHQNNENSANQQHDPNSNSEQVNEPPLHPHARSSGQDLARDNNFDDGSREEQLRLNEEGGQSASGSHQASVPNTMMMENEFDNQPTVQMEEANSAEKEPAIDEKSVPQEPAAGSEGEHSE